MEFLHKRADAFVISMETATLPFLRGGAFCIPTSREPVSLQPQQEGIVKLQIFANLIGIKWYLLVAFICISLFCIRLCIFLNV